MKQAYISGSTSIMVEKVGWAKGERHLKIFVTYEGETPKHHDAEFLDALDRIKLRKRIDNGEILRGLDFYRAKDLNLL